MKGMIKTKFVGVYRYVSDTKRFDGKPDECFYYSYRDEDKKFRWHKVGWRSEKVTAQYAADTFLPIHRKEPFTTSPACCAQKLRLWL